MALISESLLTGNW